MSAMATEFARVYSEGTWSGGSGPGSDPGTTVRWRRFLEQYLHDHCIRSVADLGCGDWQWASLMDWTGISYTGIDVVPAVVQEDTRKYGSGRIRFECADILTCDLPDADLIIVKEVLQHWPSQAIHEFRSRLEGRRALLVNDYDRNPAVNYCDISPGGYRPVDLIDRPFAWPVRYVAQYGLVYSGGGVENKLVAEMNGDKGS